MPVDGASYGPVENLSDREAMQIIVALKYWTRATRYEATPQEQQALVTCDEKAGMLWKAGAAVGGIAGFGLTSLAAKNKVPLMQRFAVSGAFASGGSFFGDYKSNKYCLDAILTLSETVRSGEDLEQQGSVASPLAAQAKQILLDGPAATARGRMEGPSQLRSESRRSNVVPSLPSTNDAMHSMDHGASAPAFDTDRPEPSVAFQPAPSGVDSWEAVRERYRARQAGEEPPSMTPASPQIDSFHASPAAPVRRRKNQYGDEVEY